MVMYQFDVQEETPIFVYGLDILSDEAYYLIFIGSTHNSVSNTAEVKNDNGLYLEAKTPSKPSAE